MIVEEEPDHYIFCSIYMLAKFKFVFKFVI